MAIYRLGDNYRNGLFGLEEDLTRAIELYERAAELGEKEAHWCLAGIYDHLGNDED